MQSVVPRASALATFLALAITTFAQGDTEDVVYLHNGSIIRGQITLLKPGESVTLQTRDGNVFVWDMGEVSEVKQEAAFEAGGDIDIDPAPAPAVRADPNSIDLSDLGIVEARGMLLAAHASLASSLSKRNTATTVQWVGYAAWAVGGIIVASADQSSPSGDDATTTGGLVALGGLVTLLVGAVQEANAMNEIVKLKETLDTRLFGIAKPPEEKPRRRYD
ncbi:hypothetical protein HN371_29230 [Candidatus Poribacteria bacterium]|jgi:hypothetical protein|nr:hypothetical protein [Candidatus Poribacteria bacterium]MBT5533493.1 hypothetical protein [Candidatus Poribacteria bacterium]MBT5710137.1 hypothetical protein [Candidatus Poribacteria bacterium]MBT7100522.1 hypothetical protein [Candidatus Poribacteria bacterium]MBT7808890.1 hypothetical protein [Candidatus Poribacteria bacterium]